MMNGDPIKLMAIKMAKVDNAYLHPARAVEEYGVSAMLAVAALHQMTNAERAAVSVPRGAASKPARKPETKP